MDKDQSQDTTQTPTAQADRTAPVLPGGQVMDIQAPKSSTTIPQFEAHTSDQISSEPNNSNQEAPGVTVIDTSQTSESTPKTDPSSVSAALGVSEQQTHSAASESISSDIATEVSSEAARTDTNAAVLLKQAEKANPDATDKLAENPLAISGQPKKKSAPLAAIIVAVVVALALSGLVLFVYMKSKSSTKQSAYNNSKTKTAKANTSQGIAPKPQATVSDIDATNKDIDTSLTKIDDIRDFSSTDLSDAALGL